MLAINSPLKLLEIYEIICKQATNYCKLEIFYHTTKQQIQEDANNLSLNVVYK